MITAFQSNAFQTVVLAFQIDVSPSIVTVDTHDGGDDRKYRDRLEAAKRLRDEVTQAFESELEPWIAQIAAADEKLRQISKPQLTDSVYVPIQDRIDWDAVANDAQAIEVVRRALVLARLAQDDDDVEALIL